jgi:UPF0716 protein FxsA
MKLRYLILLLTVVPALELVLLLQVHHAIASAWGDGTALLVTIGSIAATGMAGALLARHQGLAVLRELQQRTVQGELPGQPLMDGVLILIGAALLLTPGFLTDLFGLSLLVPVSRRAYRKLLSRWMRRKIQHGDVQVSFARSGSGVFDTTSQPRDPT